MAVEGSSAGRLFLISGPSGVGKGSLVAALLQRHPQIWLTISATTRAPRSGEGSTLAQQLQHRLWGLALVDLQQPTCERCLELGFSPRPG